MEKAQPLLAALRALAEPTRLRLLALCSSGDLTVSELVSILGQSQPRVSRHLKLLSEAGLLERIREGSWVFYRLAQDSVGAVLGGHLTKLLPDDDETLIRDLQRLVEVKQLRERAAADYFSRNAEAWDNVRSLHVDDSEVERSMLALMGAGDGEERDIGDLLDIGTGTARMLELFGPRIRRGEGIDLSHDMLAVARANLDSAGITHCSVRQADMYQMPFQAETFDAVTIHQVLHFLDRPGQAIAEAAKVLKPGGRMLVVDFAPHELESLRAEHAHRRLGFEDTEVDKWCAAADLKTINTEHLPGDPLTVTIWLARKKD
ncbi:MAG: metalloregulator ArsR/SmtB family transcription factor [Rhodospirillaceae bacterium]|nr:metalloregulator ArsR/SmtB family transcription factor [Rhodospirillaceae bacterium]